MTFTRTALLVAAGPLAWAVHFGLIYGFTGLACARGLPSAVPWVIAMVTVAAAAACVATIIAGWRKGAGFERWLAATLAAVALVAISWQALPVLLVRPCA